MADKTQRVMWTVLPNGTTADGARLRLSVLVSPELTLTETVSPPRLSQFPDFLDWPARLAAASFTLDYAGQQVALQPMSAPTSDTWRAMFTAETFVRPRVFEDMRGMRVLSFPAAMVHDHIRGIYGETALVNAGGRPTVADLRLRLGELARLRPPFEIFDRLAGGGRSAAEVGSTIRGAYELHQAFHTPLEAPAEARYTKQGLEDPRENATWHTHAIPPLPQPESFRETIDFHRIVSAMNQHRTLLRDLGLVLDFECDRDAVTPSGAADQVRLVVDWPAMPAAETGVETLENLTPSTRVILAGDRFEAAPRVATSLTAGPVLPLDDDRFRLVQVDVDGSAMKLNNFVRSLQTMQDEDIYDDEGAKPPARVGLPALRSGGLNLIEAGYGARLEGAFDRSGALHDADQAASQIELFAEDLVRGFHVDVFDRTRGEWTSLCRRTISYRFLNGGAERVVEDEEAMLRLAATQSVDGEYPNLVKLHETVVSWTGWSLAAPPVGRGIDTDDETCDLTASAPDGLPLESDVAVTPHSLPSLRFGREYRMRARIVDLAHNALAFDSGDIEPPAATSAVPYLRYEPVESPRLALVSADGAVETPRAGESMARIAIRSFNATPDHNSVATEETARRHVFAPRVPADFAIAHGVLDDAGGRIAPTSFALLSTRDDDLARIVLTAPDSGESLANPDDPSAARSKPRYAHAPEGFSLPYLPDPLADGVLVRLSVRESPDLAVLSIPYHTGRDSAWPDALPFEIAVEEGNLAAIFDPVGRRLTVALPKAETARVRLSHRIRAADLDRLGIWHWLRDQASGSLPNGLEQDAIEGRHWMLTPDRELRLYHAVQKPLITPAFLTLQASRRLERSSADISVRTPIDVKSTEKLDLLGSWNDVLDRPTSPGPVVRPARGPAQDWRVDRRQEASVDTIDVTSRHEFGDTRYRRVSYTMEATTRFREFMPEAIRNDPAALTVRSEPGVAWVPNASPPPAPEVLYVVPTFGWNRHSDEGGYRAIRDGGGLRVYLKRPWLVTGAAEMLAVVLPPRSGAIEAELQGKVTQWGSDPIWAGPWVQTPAPPRSAFPLRLEAGPLAPGTLAPGVLPDEESDLPPGPFRLDGLQSPELRGGVHTVSVVPHAVSWDPVRRLWFCDIVIEPGAVYTPFIRLALARYQPISAEENTPGRSSAQSAHLSNIVLADFAQLAPDRLVTVTRRGPQEVEVALFGAAFTGSGGAPPGLAGAGPEFEVVVQERTGDGTDELAWRPAADASIAVARERAEIAAGAGPALLAGANRLEAVLGLGTPAPTPAVIAEAEALLAARGFPALIGRLDLFAALSPPELWRATVTLPSVLPLTPLRLLISEYERFVVDGQTDAAADAFDPAPGRRLVFAEAVAIAGNGGSLSIG